MVRDGRSTVLPNETSGKEVVGKRLRGKGRSSTAQQPMLQEKPEAQETHDTGMKAALLKKELTNLSLVSFFNINNLSST